MTETEDRLFRLVRRAMIAWTAAGEAAVNRSPDEPKNCWTWAFEQRRMYGGALIMVPSTYGPWEHAQWLAPDGSIWEYNPEVKQTQTTIPTLFYGTVSRVKGPD